MTQKLYDQLINSPRGMSTAAMRDVLLPLILGQETDGILYWIGKDLARQFPVATPGDLSLLTHQLGLGDLRLTSSLGIKRPGNCGTAGPAKRSHLLYPGSRLFGQAS